MTPSPIVSVASNLVAQPGIYAVLLGSGVSAPAGIKTGWDIALDLVRRLAVAEGADTPDDPISWYGTAHGDDVDYSQLIEMLAPATGDRQSLLDQYFEASDEDREQGFKEPTRAHRAIAELVQAGFVRVIVTTNFDRLMESALHDLGVEPTVIASAADASSAAPLHALGPVVIKVNGDRRSPLVRNTLAELEAYEDAMQSLLARVFGDHGLIISGWSANWDPALCRLITENQPGVFSTYFFHRGDIGGNATELVRMRAGIPIRIEDADTAFPDLLGRVQAIQSIRAPAPNDEEILTARAKLYLPDPQKRILLQDLVKTTMENLVDSIQPSVLPTEMAEFDLSEYFERLAALGSASDEASMLLATIAHYGDEDRHYRLAVQGLGRISGVRQSHSGRVMLISAQRLPATLLLYSIGIAGLAARRPHAFATALAELEVEDLNEPATTIAYKLAPTIVLDYNALRDHPDFERHHTPASDLVHSVLRPNLVDFVTDDEDFDNLFDDVEYLIGLRALEATNRFAPIGRFGWRRGPLAGSGRGSRDGVLDRYSSELLDCGLFAGDPSVLDRIHGEYEEYLDQNPLRG